MKNVTDVDSSDFIPESDRLAVFDMDGTLFCETDPVYYEYMMLFDRIFEDNEKNGGKEKLVSEINDALKTGYISHEFELLLSDTEYEYYLNMTADEYKKYIKDFLNKKTISYENLLIKDALYKPMLEYTLGNEKYKTLGFMVICDNMERENGSPDKAKSVTYFSNEKGYVTIYMKNDWKTIYGDGVEMIKK